MISVICDNNNESEDKCWQAYEQSKTKLAFCIPRVKGI